MTPDSSPPSQDLTHKKPEDVLKPVHFEAYEILHKDIWNRLIHVNTNLTILEKIQNFPFHHIYAPQENIFWTMVRWNFLYISIVFLHSLTTDQGDRKHTLTRFANRILNDWIKETYKPSYQQRLRNAKLDKNLSINREKIQRLRHKVIAHRFLDIDGTRLMCVEGVTLAEVCQTYKDVEKLFCACSFGTQYICNLYIGGTIGGKQVKKDIDKLLDLIIKDSYWLNEPERHKDFWPAIRQHKNPKDIEELNLWRRKFSLPDA